MRAYARRSNYSFPWAEKKSKQIRRKLGVQTIEEAVEMSELAGLEGRIGGLEKKLDDAISKLAAAATPQQVNNATDSVRSIQDELRARGLTLGDLDEAAARKQDAKIDERVAAALKLRDEQTAEEARLAAEGGGDGGGDGDGDGDGDGAGSKRDGLGGVRNLLGGS